MVIILIILAINAKFDHVKIYIFDNVLIWEAVSF